MDVNTSTIDQLRQRIQSGALSRRDVLRRSLALGLGAPVVAGLLAACGGEEDEEGGGAGAGGEDGATEEPTLQPEPGGEDDQPGLDPTGLPGEDEDEAPEEGTPTVPEERGGGGKVDLLYWQAPTILNPHLAQGTKDFHAAQVCLEPLFNWNVNTEPILYLAATWPTVENGLLDENGNWVVWELKEDVLWHDGEEFTAEDVAFTWEYATNEDTTATTFERYDTIESVEILHDYAIQLNFKEPNPAWFDPFSGGEGCVLPQHILQDQVGAAARDADFNLSPIGTGPWQVSDFRPGDVVLYEIFQNYWDPGKPYFDTVEIKGGGDATSAARAVLETGEGDWAWNLQVEPAVLEQMAEGGNGEVVSVPGTSAERIMINFANPNVEVDGAFSEPSTEHPIWQYPEAREALSLAIQRELIATQLYGAAGVATGDVLNVPERLKMNNEWQYDLEQAQERLDAINFPADFDDTNILYQTSVNSVRQKNQEIVKADLETLGFTVELKSVDSGVFFSSDAGNPDTYSHFYADLEMYTNGPTSPYPVAWAERYRSDAIAQKSNNWAGTNITRYLNPDYDELHNRAQTLIDEDEQVELWMEMMGMVAEDVVEVPIVWRGDAAAVSNRIDNWSVSVFASTPIYDLKNWIAIE